MKEHLTEKFLFGIITDAATSISKAYAICAIGSIYGVSVTMGMALFAAFSFAILSLKLNKGESVPTWSEAIALTIFLVIMPWLFALVALIVSFVA